MKFFTLNTLPRGFLKACFTPRPIAWISSLSQEGRVNLAPFSFYSLVSDAPPMIVFSTTNQHIEGGSKDTLLNIEKTKKFTINVPSLKHAHQLNLTSGMFKRSINEFDQADIAYTVSDSNGVPFVKDISIRIECEYYESIRLPKHNETLVNTMIIAYVTGIGVAENVIQNGRINIASIKPIARLGYDNYTFVGLENIFELKR